MCLLENVNPIILNTYTHYKYLDPWLDWTRLDLHLGGPPTNPTTIFTLGCVMGIFIICWLPFFVTNIISGFCFQCLGPDPELVFQIVTWLGWLNSSMNPFIYACCSRDFSR